MALAHDNNIAHKGHSAAGALSRLPSEPIEDTPMYVIMCNHDLTTHVSYWNGRALLQLLAQCQDRNGSQCSIMVTMDSSEVEVRGRNIAQAESQFQKHNAQTLESTACLLFHQVSMEDTTHYRHLEVSRWQGHVLVGSQSSVPWPLSG